MKGIVDLYLKMSEQMEYNCSKNGNNMPIRINDFAKICRTCLNAQNIMPISALKYNQSSIINLLDSCASIHVEENDCLPQNLCVACLDDIIKIHLFQESCRQNESFLRVVLAQPEVVKHVVDEETIKQDEKFEMSEDYPSNKITEENCIEIVKHEVDDKIIKQESDSDSNDITEDNCIEVIKHELNDKIIKQEEFEIKSDSGPNKTTEEKKPALFNIYQSILKFSCPDCSKEFASINKLKRHRKEVNQAKARKHTCCLCDYKCASMCLLRDHMKKHTNDKPYKCSECSQEFILKRNYYRHLMIHSRERPDASKSCRNETSMDCTPLEVSKHNLIPEKSEHRYLKAIEGYRTWCATNNVKNLSSEDVLLVYFEEQTKQMKPSTLWAMYSMLRTMLEIQEKTDISKHAKLLEYLKRQNVGFKPKNSNVFSREDIEEFLNKAPVGLLPVKIALVIGISGACRSDQLVKMKMSDVTMLQEKVLVVIPDSKTLLITEPGWVKHVRDYINLRKDVKVDRFFVQFRRGHARNQPIGHNSIATFPKKIASFLKLDDIESFTSHAFKRTANLLAKDGAKATGRAEESVVYVDCSMENKSSRPMSSVASSSSSVDVYSTPNYSCQIKRPPLET